MALNDVDTYLGDLYDEIRRITAGFYDYVDRQKAEVATDLNGLAVIDWSLYKAAKFDFPLTRPFKDLKDAQYRDITKYTSRIQRASAGLQIAYKFSPGLESLEEDEKRKHLDLFWDSIEDYLPDQIAVPKGFGSSKRKRGKRIKAFWFRPASESDQTYRIVYFYAGDEQPLYPDNYLALVKLSSRDPTSRSFALYGSGQTNLSRFVAKEFNRRVRAKAFCAIAETIVEAYLVNAIELPSVFDGDQIKVRYGSHRDPASKADVRLDVQCAGNASGLLRGAYESLINEVTGFDDIEGKSYEYAIHVVVVPISQKNYYEIQRYYHPDSLYLVRTLYLHEYAGDNGDGPSCRNPNVNFRGDVFSLFKTYKGGKRWNVDYDNTMIMGDSTGISNVNIDPRYPIDGETEGDNGLWSLEEIADDPLIEEDSTSYNASLYSEGGTKVKGGMYIQRTPKQKYTSEGALVTCRDLYRVEAFTDRVLDLVAQSRSAHVPCKVPLYEFYDSSDPEGTSAVPISVTRNFEVATAAHLAVVKSSIANNIWKTHAWASDSQNSSLKSAYNKVYSYLSSSAFRTIALKVMDLDTEFCGALLETEVKDLSGQPMVLLQRNGSDYVLNVPVFDLECNGVSKDVARVLNTYDGSDDLTSYAFVNKSSSNVRLRFFAAKVNPSSGYDGASNYDSPIAVVLMPQSSPDDVRDFQSAAVMLRTVCAPCSTVLVFQYPTREYQKDFRVKNATEFPGSGPKPVEAQWDSSETDLAKSFMSFYDNIAASLADANRKYVMALDRCNKNDLIKAMAYMNDLSGKESTKFRFAVENIHTAYSRAQIDAFDLIEDNSEGAYLNVPVSVDELVDSYGPEFEGKLILVPFRSFNELLTLWRRFENAGIHHALFYESTLATYLDYTKVSLPKALLKRTYFVRDPKPCNVASEALENYLAGYVADNVVGIFDEHSYASLNGASKGNAKLGSAGIKRNEVLIYRQGEGKNDSYVDRPSPAVTSLAEALNLNFGFLQPKIAFVPVSYNDYKERMRRSKETGEGYSGTIAFRRDCPKEANNIPTQGGTRSIVALTGCADKKDGVIVLSDHEASPQQMDALVAAIVANYYTRLNDKASDFGASISKAPSDDFVLVHEDYQIGSADFERTKFFVGLLLSTKSQVFRDAVGVSEFVSNRSWESRPYVVVGENREIERVRSYVKAHVPGIHAFDVSFSSAEESEEQRYCLCPYQDDLVLNLSNTPVFYMEQAKTLYETTRNGLLETNDNQARNDEETLVSYLTVSNLDQYNGERLVVGVHTNLAVLRLAALNMALETQDKDLGLIYYTTTEFVNRYFEKLGRFAIVVSTPYIVDQLKSAPNTIIDAFPKVAFNEVFVETVYLPVPEHQILITRPVFDKSGVITGSTTLPLDLGKSVPTRSIQTSDQDEQDDSFKLADGPYVWNDYSEAVPDFAKNVVANAVRVASSSTEDVVPVSVGVYVYNQKGSRYDDEDVKSVSNGSVDGIAGFYEMLPKFATESGEAITEFAIGNDLKKPSRYSIAVAIVDGEGSDYDPNDIVTIHRRETGYKPTLVVTYKTNPGLFGTRCGTSRTFYVSNENLDAVNTIGFIKYAYAIAEGFYLTFDDKTAKSIVDTFDANIGDDRLIKTDGEVLVYAFRAPDDVTRHFADQLQDIYEQTKQAREKGSNVKFRVVSEESAEIERRLRNKALEDGTSIVFLVPMDMEEAFVKKYGPRLGTNTALVVYYSRGPFWKKSVSKGYLGGWLGSKNTMSRIATVTNRTPAATGPGAVSYMMNFIGNISE